jgi:hypothetical protein
MIAKGFTPLSGAKVFAIMKHPRVFHDREGFNTPWSSKSFAIMKITLKTKQPHCNHPFRDASKPSAAATMRVPRTYARMRTILM